MLCELECKVQAPNEGLWGRGSAVKIMASGSRWSIVIDSEQVGENTNCQNDIYSKEKLGGFWFYEGTARLMWR